MIFGHQFKEDSCPFMKLIVLLFHSSFIQLVVEIDDYFDEIKHVANEFFIAHNFVLKIVLEASSKYCHKCGIVSFDKIDIFLKFSCVVCCKDSLS